MPAMFSGSDRLHEFSLRVLTVIVVVAMVASGILLLYRSLAPKEHNVGQPWSSMTVPAEPAAPAAVAPAPTTAPEKVLMSPEHVFRCDSHGRVSFSDRACESGAEQVMPMTTPHGANPAAAAGAAGSSPGAPAPSAATTTPAPAAPAAPVRR